MDKKLKISLCLIVLFLLATISICIYTIKENSIVDNEQNLDYTYEKMKSKMTEKALKQMVYYEDFTIDTTWIMRNYKAQGLLNEYIEERPALILFYPKHFCQECFDGDLYRFNEVSKRNKGYTYILSTQLTNRDMYIWGKEQGVVTESLQIKPKQEKLFTEIEEPCFFILTKDMKVHLFFNPDPDFPELSDWYFEKVESIFQNK